MYLTIDEVAARLRVSEETVRRWCRTGQLQAQRIGRQYRITETNLTAFLRNQDAEPKKVEALTTFAARASLTGISPILAG